MAEFGPLIRTYKNAEYSIEFQKDTYGRIFGLYSPKGGVQEECDTHGISKEILEKRLNQGDTPYIKQGRVHWLNEVDQNPEKPPIRTSSKIQSISPSILTKDQDLTIDKRSKSSADFEYSELNATVNDLTQKVETGTANIEELLNFQDKLIKSSGAIEKDQFETLQEKVEVMISTVLESGNTTKSSISEYSSINPIYMHEGTPYYQRATSGQNNACAIHAILGTPNERGTYQFEGNAKKHYTDTLKAALETQPENRTPGQQRAYNAYSASIRNYLTGSDDGAKMLFSTPPGNGLKQRYLAIETETRGSSPSFKDQLAQSRVDEGNIWLNLVDQESSPYLDLILDDVKAVKDSNSRWYKKNKEKVLGMLRESPELIVDFVHQQTDPNPFLKILESSDKDRIEEEIKKRRDILEGLPTAQEKFITSEEMIQNYLTTVNSYRFYLDTNDIKVVASLFDKTVVLFGGLEATNGEVINGDYGLGEPVVVQHVGAHFSRCVKDEDLSKLLVDTISSASTMPQTSSSLDQQISDNEAGFEQLDGLSRSPSSYLASSEANNNIKNSAASEKKSMAAISFPLLKRSDSNFENIDPEDKNHFDNVRPSLDALKKNVNEETLKKAFEAFETLNGHFHLAPPDGLKKNLPRILECFEEILFRRDIDKIDLTLEPSLYQVLKRNGDFFLRNLINDLDLLPIEEQTERKIRYLLWIARTEDKNQKPFDIVLPYYVRILTLSEGRFNQECRDHFFKAYERFLSDELPKFEQKLQKTLLNNLEDFKASCQIFDHLRIWNISPKILILYLEKAQAAIVKLPPDDKEKAYVISNILAQEIQKLSSTPPDSERPTPLETHLQKLHDYRQRFQDTFNTCYETSFSQNPPSFIFEKVAALQNDLFNHFSNFYQKTLIQDSPFLFPLTLPPHHEIHLTGSSGRKEVTPYSDLELFVLINQKNWIGNLLSHLNLELEKKPEREEAPLPIKFRDFEYLEKLPKQEKENLDALQKFLKIFSSKEESLPKYLIQERWIERLKKEIQKYFDIQGSNPSQTLKENIRNILNSLRHLFEINTEEYPDIIESLEKKELFSSNTANLLNELLMRNDLEGAGSTSFREYFRRLNLTCSIFGEGPPPSYLGLEEKGVKKGLFLDIPEEGIRLLCCSPEEYAPLQTRKGCYTDLQSPPFEYSLLKSTPLEPTSLSEKYQNTLQDTLDTPLPPQEKLPGMETLRHKIALNLISFRVKNFQNNLPESIDPKKDLIQHLYYPLTDLAIYFSIEETNTLEIISALTKKGILTEDTSLLLKEAAAFLYMIRIRCQIQGKEKIANTSNPKNIPKDTHNMTPHEKTQLDIAYHLAIKPLQNHLQKISKIHMNNLEKNRKIESNNPLKVKAPLDLLKEAFDSALTINPTAEDLCFIHSLSAYLLKTNPLQENHLKYYHLLSNHVDPIEPLREIFLKHLPNDLITNLEKIPNPFGQRLILKRKRECFFQNLSELLSAEKAKGKTVPFIVSITSPFFKGGYLPADAIDALFDKEGHIKKQAQGTNSRVARYSAGPLDFHFKEKPSNPSKESPFHPGREHAAAQLMSRLFGRGTSTSELFEITVQGTPQGQKKYLALISETVSGKAPNPENPPDIDPIQLSELFLSLPLLLPGDMRPLNLIATPQQELISIDNDVSWVKPYTKDGCNLYTALPFLYPNFTLHPDAIENFLALKPNHLLMGWLEELVVYNKTILGDKRLKFYEETLRKTLWRDPKHYTSTCSFQRGTGGQLISQFCNLQAFLEKRKNSSIRGVEILQTIISLDEDRLSLVGEKIYSDYEKAQNNPQAKTADKVKDVTRRRNTESISMTQSQKSLFGKIPESAQELKNYTPENALKEVKELFILKFEELFLSQREKFSKLETKGGMKEIDELDQRYLFKAFLFHTFEHLELSYSFLTDKELELFLEKSGETLKVLDLRHCPNLTDKAIIMIVDQCAKLEELYLSHCPGIKHFAYAISTTFRGFRYSKARLPKLKTLHLGDCKYLESIQIDAPEMSFLKVNDNPNLINGYLEAPGCKIMDKNSGNLTLERGVGDVQKKLPQGIQTILEKDKDIDSYTLELKEGLPIGFFIENDHQEFFLKTLVDHRYRYLNLSCWSALTDNYLKQFLSNSGDHLAYLNLDHCEEITDAIFPEIVVNCPNLKELYMSHCPKLIQVDNFKTSFLLNRRVLGDHLNFESLEELHFSNCNKLKILRLNTPNLKCLKITNNPCLISVSLNNDKCRIFCEGSPNVKNLEKTENIEEKGKILDDNQRFVQSVSFGVEKWEKLVGIKKPPTLPKNIYEILQSPCSFWPDKKVYETHLLILFPKYLKDSRLNTTNLNKLIENYNFDVDFKDEYGLPVSYNMEVARSCWALITREIIPSESSIDKKDFGGYNDRLLFLRKVSNVSSSLYYEIPSTLDLMISIVIELTEDSLGYNDIFCSDYFNGTEKFSKISIGYRKIRINFYEKNYIKTWVDEIDLMEQEKANMELTKSGLRPIARLE